jgi:hypothetical protein
MLAGTRTDEAAVIEHTGKRAVVREMERGYLAVANHYVSFDLRKKNGNDEEWLEDSRARYEAALLGLGARRGRQLLDLLHILGREPVLHGLTAHRMVFIPKTGKHYVAYRDTDRAVALWLRLGDSGTSA